MLRRLWLSFVGFLMVVALAFPGLAQSDRAGVVGTISDPSGATVPETKVKVVNLETGQAFEATTDRDGRYVVPSILKPGNYQVEASKEGFKTAVSGAFTLQIGDVREVNLKLELGRVAEQITVTAETPLIETQTSNLGEVISGRQVTELPLKDRNFVTLATLAPGVHRVMVGVLVDQTAFNQGDPNAGSVPGLGDSRGSSEASRFSRSGGAAISVNGLRPTNNNFSLDGVDNNEPQFQTIGVFPNPDAIQEFKVETSIPKAEVGRGGAVINTSYRSGTNSLHGSTYYFGQNDALNATPWLINRNRNRTIDPTTGKPTLRKSVERVNEFGFTAGGPIIKNRTFIFGDYLGQRNRFPNPFQTAVPTALSRTGNFSEFSDPVLDPLTCKKPGDISSGGCKAFPGNIITNLANRPDFSPPALKLLNLYPLPTTNVKNPNQGNQNFFGLRRNRENIDSFDIKADHKISDKNNITGRYTRDNQERVRANFFTGLPTAGFGAGEETGNTRQIVVSDTHVFRPTLLNEARFGWTQVKIGILNCGVEGACGEDPGFCTTIGIPNCNKGTPATTGGILTGGFGTGEFEFIGDGGLFLVKSNNFYFNDSLSIIHGKHTLKTGVEGRPRQLDTIDGGRAGGLKGHIQYATPFSSTTTGNVQADYLLSRPAMNAFSGTIIGGDNPLQLRTTEWGLFVQDDWKVTPQLTLNLGLRYELFPNFTEKSGRLANFDLRTSSIAKAKGSGDRIVNTAKANFGPRVGFAYNFGPEKQFVLRGGYGLFYAQDGVDFPPLGRNPPVISSVTFGVFSGNSQVFNLTTGPPVAPVTDPPIIDTSTNLFAVEPTQKVSAIHEWNAGVQWQFAKTFVFDVGYVASRSRHLFGTRDLGNGNNGLGLVRTAKGDPISSVILYDHRSSSNYDSLQASLEKRFSSGLQFRSSYTWGHTIDDSTGVFGGAGETRGTNGGPLNPLNFRVDRGTSSLDRRQVLVTNMIYDLPIGKGKAFGGDVSGRTDKVIGGWQLNVIWSAQTGQPFDVSSNSPSGGNTRADLVGNPLAGLAPDRFLGELGFAPPSGSVTNLAGKKIFVGNLGRNTFRGPGFFRTDLSLFKTTSVNERLKVQFGIEFFNAWNQVHHVVPNNDINRSDPSCDPTNLGGFNPPACSFGRFDNAFPPRQIQYRLKVIF